MRANRWEILAGCGLIALGLWSVIGLLLHQARSNALEAATAANHNIARTLAEYQNSSIRAIDLSLKLLRDDWKADPNSFAVAVARHEQHLSKEKVVQVAVLDREGWPLYSQVPVANRPGFAKCEFFDVHRTRSMDELDISAPVQKMTGSAAIQFTRPLLDSSHRFAGIMLIAVPPPALESVFKDIKLGGDGIVTLARADGTVLARIARPSAVRVSLVDSPGLSGDSPVWGDFITSATVDGQKRMFAYRRLESYPLTMFVGLGVDTALATYSSQRDLVLLGASVASVLLFAVAFLLVSQNNERARHLADRERVVHELHDGCIQSIYAIGLALEHCRRLLDKEPAQVAGALAEAQANLSLVIQDLRVFISGTERAPYTQQEFMAEIERIIPRSGPEFAVDVDRDVVASLSAAQAAHVLRIAREAVSNVVRHANACSARLALQRSGEMVRLDVSDDGRGIAAQAGSRLGLGLHHIKARARKLGGRASVRGAPDGGTHITVEFPPRA